MLRLLLPPNLAAAAPRDAIAVKVELDPAAAPSPALLPALTLLQLWCGTPKAPAFLQLTRAQLRELTTALHRQPVFFQLNAPTVPLLWLGPLLIGVSEHLRETPGAAPPATRKPRRNEMAFVEPTTLAARGIRLVPLSLEHEEGLRLAAADGELWRIRVTSVPEPGQTRQYIAEALAMREAGNRFAFAVTDEATGTVLGSTSYHDILPAVRRVEIGWTWYAKRCQRTHVNTTCKLLMLTHAFETLHCHVVGWRTDNFNHASQRAIERLGARKDGVIRGHALRRDGSIRDTVMYSLRSGEWPEVRTQLLYLLDKPR